MVAPGMDPNSCCAQGTCKTVLYGLQDPGDGKFRYVGETHDLKQRTASYKARKPIGSNRRVTDWLAEMRKAGRDIVVVQLDGDRTEDDWIQQLLSQGHPLLNGSIGNQRIIKRGQPKTTTPLLTFPLRMARDDFLALNNIMRMKGFKDKSKAARAAIRAMAASLDVPGEAKG